MTTSNQHTRYIEVNKGYATIRLDKVGSDTLVTVYNVNVKDIDLLIEKLQAVKAEYVEDFSQFKTPGQSYEDNSEETPQMTAVLGPKPNPKTMTRIIANRTAQGFSPKAIVHQIKKHS